MVESQGKYERPNGDPNKKNLFLYFATVIVHITSFTIGVAFTWVTPISTKLQSISENPLGVPLSIGQISWLASLVSLGAFIGPFAGGYFADTIGRKYSFISTGILSILSFALLAFGNHLYIYYFARLLSGICIGIYITILPMYIGEIAEIHNRGTLASLIGFFIVLGNLFSFAIGPYISIETFSLSCMVGPILFLILFTFFIPDTPCYLIMKRRYSEARKSLRKFRSGDVEYEFIELMALVKESLTHNGGILDIFKTKALRKGLTITIGLMIIQQLTAISPVILYLQTIFESTGSNLSNEVSAIIIGVVQIIATILTSLTVDRYGRKPLLMISTVLTSLSLAILSLYFYLLNKIDVSHISWLPLITLILYIFAFNLGIGPLPLTILSEIFPPHVKSAASTLSVAMSFGFSFGISKFFPIIIEVVDNWFAYSLFSILNGFGIIFIWRQIPETKGKTLTEILEFLK